MLGGYLYEGSSIVDNLSLSWFRVFKWNSIILIIVYLCLGIRIYIFIKMEYIYFLLFCYYFVFFLFVGDYGNYDKL